MDEKDYLLKKMTKYKEKEREIRKRLATCTHMSEMERYENMLCQLEEKRLRIKQELGL